MSALSQAIDKPQTLLLRKALFQVHLWVGIAIGVWAFLIGLTGSILVFHEQIDDGANAMVTTPFLDPGFNAPKEQVLATVRTRFPKGLVSLKLPERRGEAAVANIYMGNESYVMLLNPHTAAAIALRNRSLTLLQVVGRFHSNLMLNRPGRVANGILALFTLLLALTGIVVWWPGRAQWKRRLKVNFRAPWRVWIWELHHAAGFWCLIYIVLSAATGAYFTWPQVYRDAISKFSPITQRPRYRIEPPGAAARRPLDELLDAADRALPGLPLHEIQLPSDGNQPVRVVKLEGKPASMRTLSFVVLNPYTAEVLGVERPASATAGDAVFGWIGPLHTGHFGGTWVAVLWALLGLSMPVLFLTGFLMWWNRVIARRL